MRTLQVSQFKAHCLGLLKEIRDTGESLVVTLRGEPLAVIRPPGDGDLQQHESVSETLERLRPLLLAEETDLEPPPRQRMRGSARHPISDED